MIYPLGGSFSYDVDSDNYKGAKWIIDNLTDVVAKGGCFMVGIGPDENGRFHPEAVLQLEEVGRWLAVNGEGIYNYNTRSRNVWKENKIKFTQSKNTDRVYAFINDLSNEKIVVNSIKPRDSSEIILLGYDRPLHWELIDSQLQIYVPEDLRKGINVPCNYMWIIVFEQ